MRKYLSELIGTLVLVLFGCGVAVFTDGDIVATSLAFGLSIIALAYVIGNISGCHVNPAITISMLIDRRISLKDAIFYIISQIIGAILGTLLLMFMIKSSNLGEIEFVGLGQNGYGVASASNINLFAALVTEVILTFVFTFAVLGVTADSKKHAVAPVVIGLTLAFVHLLGIRLTGTSVNPARSLSPAIFMGGKALEQVWVFIVGPFIGAVVATFIYKFIKVPEEKEIIKEEKVELKKTTTRKTTKKAK